MSLLSAVVIFAQVFGYSILTMFFVVFVITVFLFLKDTKKKGIRKTDNPEAVNRATKLTEKFLFHIGFNLMIITILKFIVEDPSYALFGMSSCLFFIQCYNMRRSFFPLAYTVFALFLFVVAFIQTHQVVL